MDIVSETNIQYSYGECHCWRKREREKEKERDLREAMIGTPFPNHMPILKVLPKNVSFLPRSKSLFVLEHSGRSEIGSLNVDTVRVDLGCPKGFIIIIIQDINERYSTFRRLTKPD